MISISVRALPLLLALLASETNAQVSVNFSNNCYNKASCGSPTATVTATHLGGSFTVDTSRGQGDLNAYVANFTSTLTTQANRVAQRVVEYNTVNYNHSSQTQAEQRTEGAQVVAEWNTLGSMLGEARIVKAVFGNTIVGHNAYVAPVAATPAVIGQPARIGTSATPPSLSGITATTGRLANTSTWTIRPDTSSLNSSHLPTRFTATGTRNSSGSTFQIVCTYTTSGATVNDSGNVSAGTASSWQSISITRVSGTGSTPSNWTGGNACPTAGSGELEWGIRAVVDNAIAGNYTSTTSASTYVGVAVRSTVPAANFTPATVSTPATPGSPEVLANSYVQCGNQITGGPCTNN